MDSTQSAIPGHGVWPELPAPLSIPVPDSHCHLDIEFSPDKYGPGLSVDDAIAHAAAVGVNRIVQIGCDTAGAKWAVDTAQHHPEIVAGVAIHPNEAPRLAASDELTSALRLIEELAGDPNVLVVGETGLDYYRTLPAGRASQEESFRWHIRLANKLDKTLVIHDRDAHDDVVRVLL
ncbi:MAG TPA: TatD family hydrolase, partial [Burkholderiaceae bacterium]|nr:TatD family hydrolase [Burkholderiaceae bacterium]